jgi:DNA mismatch repair protein MSH5
MNLLRPRPALAFGHMEVRVDTEASEVSDQIVYLYKQVITLGLTMGG